MFQFTHPVWGATASLACLASSGRCFNSRTPCGVRLDAEECALDVWWVSIHAPRVGCDTTSRLASGLVTLFQFTHPVWGATEFIGIHKKPSTGFNSRTPCGVRPPIFDGRGRTKCFNSRTPCGVRLGDAFKSVRQPLFQFTHPVWGATHPKLVPCSFTLVSIHAPRVGCDRP